MDITPNDAEEAGPENEEVPSEEDVPNEENEAPEEAVEENLSTPSEEDEGLEESNQEASLSADSVYSQLRCVNCDDFYGEQYCYYLQSQEECNLVSGSEHFSRSFDIAAEDLVCLDLIQ